MSRIAPAPTQDATSDSKLSLDMNKRIDELRLSLKNDAALTAFLLSMSRPQLSELTQAYSTMFNRPFHLELLELHNNDFGRLCSQYCMPPLEFDADCIHEALKGVGSKNAILIQVLFNRTPKDIKSIDDIYRKRNGSDLEKDFKKEFKGSFEHLFLSLLRGIESIFD
jgi:annexin A7/11